MSSCTRCGEYLFQFLAFDLHIYLDVAEIFMYLVFSMVKHLSRGWNSCSRCDFYFKTQPDSKWAKIKADRHNKRSSHTAGAHSTNHARHENRRDERRESEKSTEHRPPSRPQVSTCSGVFFLSCNVLAHNDVRLRFFCRCFVGMPWIRLS